MPRAPRTPDRQVEENQARFSFYEEKPSFNHPVSFFLSKEIFRLRKLADEEMICPICLDEICCDKCNTILVCGHQFHLCCICKVEMCPMCRK
jgi:hypothetical protein